ncbi:MAG: helix-turn-helix domain-containing protein [Phycisphaeraceae bacterium]
MAKMFYTLEEAAEKLGVDTDTIKEMATEGKLQQFRDRDKLMFKREQVDQLAGGADADASGGPIPLDDSGEISLKDDTSSGSELGLGGSGTSVFDSDEIAAADQTQAGAGATGGPGAGDDLNIESVGSGSGLLDLTSESDDTSLGEVLDDLSGDSGQASGMAAELGASDAFESAVDEDAPDMIGAAAPVDDHRPDMAMSSMYEVDTDDPAGSGFGTGMLIGAMLALVLALVAVLGAMMGVRDVFTATIADSQVVYLGSLGGLLALSLLLGGIGYMIGKASDAG